LDVEQLIADGTAFVRDDMRASVAVIVQAAGVARRARVTSCPPVTAGRPRQRLIQHVAAPAARQPDAN